MTSKNALRTSAQVQLYSNFNLSIFRNVTTTGFIFLGDPYNASIVYRETRCSTTARNNLNDMDTRLS